MELFIQMGHNMQALALEHLEEFDGGTIIISPMNILPNKVKVMQLGCIRKRESTC